MKFEDTLKAEMCQIGHMMWQAGYAPCNSGNICVKVNENEYFATPTLVCKGLLTPDMILRIRYEPDLPEDQRITVLESNQPYQLTSEIRCHLVAMQTVKTANASIHAHTPYARTLSYMGINRLQMPEEVGADRGVRPWPVMPYKAPGTWDLANGNIEGFKISHDGVIMGCHGPISTGEDLVTAFQNLEDIEASARNIYMVQVFLGATKNGLR